MRNTNDREGKMTMEPRKQFTFYRSYWEALSGLPGEDRLAVLDAVIPYALYGTPPGELSTLAATAFLLIKPTLDAGRKKAEYALKAISVHTQGDSPSDISKVEKESDIFKRESNISEQESNISEQESNISEHKPKNESLLYLNYGRQQFSICRWRIRRNSFSVER